METESYIRGNMTFSNFLARPEARQIPKLLNVIHECYLNEHSCKILYLSEGSHYFAGDI